MRFSITFAASALVALATAQYQPNPFNIPAGGLYFAVGAPTTLSWAPTTPGTVSLVLRDGVTTNLNPGILIASSILNYGTFTYTPAAANSIPGTPYTVEIVSDANPSMINFTPQFVINGASAAAPPATAGAYAVESMATAAASSIWHPSSMTTFSSTSASDSGAANLEVCGVLLAVVASLFVFMV